MQWSVMDPAVDGTSAWRDLHVSLHSHSQTYLIILLHLYGLPVGWHLAGIGTAWTPPLAVHLTLVDWRSSL